MAMKLALSAFTALFVQAWSQPPPEEFKECENQDMYEIVICNSDMCNICILLACKEQCDEFRMLPEFVGCQCPPPPPPPPGQAGGASRSAQGEIAPTPVAPPAPAPGPKAEWPRVGGSTRVCDASPSNPLVVASRGACEGQAKTDGTLYYSFNSVTGECVTTNMCPDYIEDANSKWAGATYRQTSLWPSMTGIRCVDPVAGENSFTVEDEHDCQALATSKGHVRFQYKDGTCSTFNACEGFTTDLAAVAGYSIHVQAPAWEEMSIGVGSLICPGLNGEFSSERILVPSVADCQTEATSKGHEYFATTAEGKCVTQQSCQPTAADGSSAWKQYHQGTDFRFLGNHRCGIWDLSAARLIYPSEADCKNAALTAGHTIYSYRPGEGKCIIRDDCNEQNGPKWVSAEMPPVMFSDSGISSIGE